ncbi:MAG: hypothetical protein ABUS79_07995 [Pseudomonadota bacterium]
MDEDERPAGGGAPPNMDKARLQARVDDMNSLLTAMRAIGREDDAEMARFPAELTPSLSEATRARISDQILLVQARERSTRDRSSPARAMVASDVTGPGAVNADVDVDGEQDALARRRNARAQSRRTILMGGGGVALAAAAALTLWMRPTDQGPALPAYSVTASGGVADVRGARPDPTLPDNHTAPIERIRAESELRVTCRPDSATEGPVAARAFFVQGTTVEEVRPTVEIADTGAVDLRLRGSDLVGRHRGPGSLRVVVGRPDAVRSIDPRSAAAERPEGFASASDQRWLTVPLDIDGA